MWYPPKEYVCTDSYKKHTYTFTPNCRRRHVFLRTVLLLFSSVPFILHDGSFSVHLLWELNVQHNGSTENALRHTYIATMSRWVSFVVWRQVTTSRRTEVWFYSGGVLLALLLLLVFLVLLDSRQKRAAKKHAQPTSNDVYVCLHFSRRVEKINDLYAKRQCLVCAGV